MSHPFVQKIRQLAQQFPDREAVCRYVNQFNNGPECIVGAAAYELGLPLYRLRICEGLPARTVIRELQEVASDIPDPTPAETRWIETVQRIQDSGFPWREAVTDADTDIGRV